MNHDAKPGCVIIIIVTVPYIIMIFYLLGGHQVAEKNRPTTAPSSSKRVTGISVERLFVTSTLSPSIALRVI
jgi:hypothetical protein